MKLVVVTPTLNRSMWLDATAASVRAAHRGALHVLVAPTTELETLRARYPQAIAVAERDGGMYAAINAGAAAAGDWDALSYLNDDDLLLPGFRAIVRAVDAARSRALIAYGRVKLVDGNGNRLGAIPVSPFPSMNRALYAQCIEPVYQHGTVITRPAWERLGGFDESLRFCGDSELLARACTSNIPFRFVNCMAGAFRLRAGQLTKNRANMIAERRQVDRKLNLVTEQRSWSRRLSRLVFRSANVAVYIERLLRHGPASFDDLLERLG